MSIFEQGIKAGEGEILLLCPRHPDRSIKQDQTPVTWKEALHDINVDLEAGKWGIGPQQDAEEVESLTFCCCESCHGSHSLQGVSNAMCGHSHNTSRRTNFSHTSHVQGVSL